VNILKSVLVAFAMFSALPVPQVEWDRDSLRWALCAFPLVGVPIALLCRAWLGLCAAAGLPPLLRGALLCLIPVLVTGGIHLDGYADTCDALASHGSVEKKQEILRDPHIGAFAVIRLCMYFIASLALWTALPALRLSALLGLFGLSRSLSGLALVRFPLREGSGLARGFAEAADSKRVRTGLLVETGVFALLLILGGQLLSVLAAGLVFGYYRRLCVRDFGGLSGDLAGWFLQTAELWMLAAMVLTEIGRGLP
jgi:adenosylcobinamide-GDP ribazoletransferase